MRFLIYVIDSSTGSANAEEMAAIDVFNDELIANGHWIFAGGITAPGQATVVDNRSGAGLVMPGPLVSQAEHLSGFWLIEAPDGAAARTLAHEASRARNRKVELQPLLG
jgi:hypothetical protein